MARWQSARNWREVLVRTYRETLADNGLGLAAQLAFYFFLALFPALLFLIALAGLIRGYDLVTEVVALLDGVAPGDVVAIIRDQLMQIAANPHGGLLTFGAAAALWSSSAAMVAIIDALNRAYDVSDWRPWWRRRLLAVGLTVGGALFMLVSIALVIAGPQLARLIGHRVGFGPVFEWTWILLQWPLVFGLVATAFSLVYYLAPNVQHAFVWLSPGAVVATAIWMAGSVGFRIYLVNFGSYQETYGAIGAVMVLLLWLYLSGLAMVIGAELNAEIDRGSARAA
jgi:membrane protein